LHQSLRAVQGSLITISRSFVENLLKIIFEVFYQADVFLKTFSLWHVDNKRFSYSIWWSSLAYFLYTAQITCWL